MQLQHRAGFCLLLALCLVASACGPEGPLTMVSDAASEGPSPAALSLRFERAPAVYVGLSDHALGIITVRITDALGGTLPEIPGLVTLSAEGASLSGPQSAPLERGIATFAGLSASGPGALTLHFRHPLASTLSAPVLFALSESYVAVTPREAREGIPYDEALPEGARPQRYLLSRGELPAGLSLDSNTGRISGTPRGPEGCAQTDVVGYDQDFNTLRYGVHLAVFDRDDQNNDSAEDLTADGDFLAGHISARLSMADNDPEVPVLITYPTRSLGGPPAEGRFPVVVFHQAVPIVGTQMPIYDRYDALFNHWATRGYISISVDATRVFFRTGASSSIINLSFLNLLRVHRYIRAEIDYLHGLDRDPEHPLFGHMDFDHLVVAGHSRGGGGAVVALSLSPEVLGSMALEPVNPLGSPGGARMFNTPLPPRPLLLVSAGLDGDVIYPIVDTIYEQTTGPTSMLTIRGGKHAFTKRVEPVDPGPPATITASEQVAITLVYTTAFLDRYARMNLSRESVLFGPRGLSTSITQAPRNGVLLRARRYISSLPVIDFSGTTPMTTLQGGLVGSAGTSALRVANAFDTVLRRSMLTGSDWSAAASYARALNAVFQGSRAEVTVPLGSGLDVRDRLALVFSVERDASLLRELTLRVSDAAGRAARVSVSGHAGEVGIADRWSSVIVPLGDLSAATPELDLGQLTEIALEFGGGPSSGELWLDEVRFE